MEFIGLLWHAILLSAFAAWFWSFLSWAAMNLHGPEFRKLPDEDAFSNALRGMNIPRGVYMFPYSGGNDSRSPEFQAKWNAGPVGMLHVWTPSVSMARNMLLTYLTYVVASLLTAYVGHEVLPVGSDFSRVFRVVGTIGVLTYCFAFIPTMIWFQGQPRAMVMAVVDGLVQGLCVAAVFAWLWPKA
jgi:hypothetical protein